ncbi:glycoside hydrolase family 43 protein [Oleiagrimonas sp. C23AA]|nr:glycoside hydrolase family 43 protein [Oleiagrimonas sp. C23AA]
MWAWLLALVPLLGFAQDKPLSAHFSWFDYRGGDPSDMIKAGPDTYRNPILHGFYSDPSITRAGRDYYLVSSTFAYFPGIPVFHSRDLVHWTQIGNAISRPGQLDFKHLRLSRGVFAPAITYHDGLFYILNTCVDCGGNYLITAKNPAGPWSDPVWLPGIDGIDVSLFFDDDGRAWIVNNGPPPEKPRYQGHRAIWLQQFDPKTQKMIGPRTVLVDGGVHPQTHPVWIEGPHLLKHDGYYYLSAAQGGTAEQHSQVVLRARKITGPYMPYADNPILTQRDLPAGRALPVTSAGHADMVQTPDGAWWATFLAVRPYKGNFYNTGRETFLLPVTWKQGWPVILPHGARVPYVHVRPHLPLGRAAQPTAGAFHIRNRFDSKTLPLDWMMLRNPRSSWWHTGHGLTITARAVHLGDKGNPSFLGRRQQHMDAHVETRMLFTPRHDGDKAGLVALQNDDYFYFVGLVRTHGHTEIQVDKRAGADDPKQGAVVARQTITLAPGQPLYLGIDTKGGQYSFRYATQKGRWTTLLRNADGTILSTQTAGGFVGAVMGVYAATGKGH